MNNEPVAWMSNGKEFYVQKNYCPDFIPLYTHPAEHDLGIAEAIGFDKGYKSASVKELTDEEIKAVYGEYFDVENCDWLHLQCIQAILRKAQEKCLICD